MRITRRRALASLGIGAPVALLARPVGHLAIAAYRDGPSFARSRARSKEAGPTIESRIAALAAFLRGSRSKNRALRVRADDPTEGVEPPDRGPKKGKQYLFPSEFLQLVSEEDVPLAWRRAFALSVYLYVRPGELAALTWQDVDLVHGMVHIHRSVCGQTGRLKEIKTGETRRVPIEPTLMPLPSNQGARAQRKPTPSLPNAGGDWPRTETIKSGAKSSNWPSPSIARKGEAVETSAQSVHTV
jgi:integrase